MVKMVVENLIIDNQEVICIDRGKSTKFKVTVKGAENLQSDVGDSNISMIKYVANNTILENHDITITFNSFRVFYMGYEEGTQDIYEYIISKNKLNDFQKILNKIGIYSEIKSKKVDGKMEIFFKFKNKEISFDTIASVGTNTLTIFYFWYLKIQENEEISISYCNDIYHLAKEVKENKYLDFVKLLREKGKIDNVSKNCDERDKHPLNYVKKQTIS